MIMPTKKKTAQKKVAAKKTASKEVVATPKVKKESTATQTVVEKQPVKEVAPKTTPVQEKKKNTREVSNCFYAVFILMFIVLYAELIAGMVIFYNYQIEFREKTHITQSVSSIQHGRRRSVRRPTRNRSVQRVNKQSKNNVPALRCPPPVKRNVVFDEKQYAPYAAKGNAVIEGKLCLPLKDGTVKCFENAEVFINPKTNYSDEWYQRGWAGRENLQAPNPRAYDFNKKVRTTKDGSFKFEGLPAGSYYVASAVCLPEAKDTPKCAYHRYATTVDVSNTAKATLKQVYP